MLSYRVWHGTKTWHKRMAWYGWRTHRKRPDLLRDTRRFRPSDLGRSKRVEESGLSVVHVSHDANDWRSRRETVEGRLRYHCSTQIAALTGKRLPVGMERDGMGRDGMGRNLS